jgi:hypothetical protein
MTENEISRPIVEGAIEVHRTLGGPGLLESVYEEALVWELQQRGLEVRRQVSLSIPYKGHILASPLEATTASSSIRGFAGIRLYSGQFAEFDSHRSPAKMKPARGSPCGTRKGGFCHEQVFACSPKHPTNSGDNHGRGVLG